MWTTTTRKEGRGKRTAADTSRELYARLSRSPSFSTMAVVPVVVRRWESPHKVFFFILLATHPLDLSFSPLWEGGGRGGGRGYAVHFFFLSTLSLVASQGSIRRRRRRRWSSFFFLFSPNCFKLVFRPFFSSFLKRKTIAHLYRVIRGELQRRRPQLRPLQPPFSCHDDQTLCV